MNKSKIISITLLVLFHIMFIYTLVMHWHEVTTYLFLAMYVLLFYIWTMSNRDAKRCRKILDAVSAEHKLYRPKVTVLQSGHIRMRVDCVSSKPFSFKSNLGLFVNVPAGVDAQATEVTIETISEITKELDSEGVLVSCHMGINSVEKEEVDEEVDEKDNKPQRVFPLHIVVNENITPERFGKFHDTLLKAIMDNGCNDIEHFTIIGTDTGTVYKHYRGNLCVGMIECEFNKRLYLNSSFDRSIYFGENEHEHSEKQYKELRDSIGVDYHKMTLDEATKIISQIWKKPGKGIRYSMFMERDTLSISISNQRSQNSVHLTNQDGLWWIYGYGNMLPIPVLSTESETEATRMMIRLMINIKNQISNR